MRHKKVEAAAGPQSVNRAAAICNIDFAPAIDLSALRTILTTFKLMASTEQWKIALR